MSTVGGGGLTPERWFEIVDRLLTQMIDHQHGKVLALARRIVLDLTPEDLRNPQDFPALVCDPVFNYEDGQLAGLRSAHIALRAEWRQLTGPAKA